MNNDNKESIVYKASNFIVQSQNSEKKMKELHEKLIADGFTWDGMDGYSKTEST